MTTIKTTRYYLNIFGSIQRDLRQVSGDKNSPKKDDIFEYEFKDDILFFSHFQRLSVKTLKGKLFKGNTLIGMYERQGSEYRDRPRRRVNSQKYRDKRRDES